MNSEKYVSWCVFDERRNIIVYDGYLNIINVAGIDYISTFDDYEQYIDFYDIIETTLYELNKQKLQLKFTYNDTTYCINQVQKIKNKYKDNFPEIVYINGEAIKFNYTESIFEILAKYYKRYE